MGIIVLILFPSQYRVQYTSYYVWNIVIDVAVINDNSLIYVFDGNIFYLYWECNQDNNTTIFSLDKFNEDWSEGLYKL